MHWRALSSALLAAALATFGAHPARASYTEAHQTGDDVRIRVDGNGHAHVEHTLSWHVVAGQKRTFDLVGVEASAVLQAQATATGEDDHEVMAQVAPKAPSPGSVASTAAAVAASAAASLQTLVVTMDDPKALRRGKYRLRIAYDVDLVAEHELVRDGSMWRLTWKGALPPEGYDGARVVLDVPGAATEPRAVRPDSDGADESILSSLRREVERDELELVRPHVARGEAPVWSVLLSPRALPGLHMAAITPASASVNPVPRPIDRQRLLLGALALLVIGGVYGLLVGNKQRAFGASCREAGALVRAAVPLPLLARPLVAGLAIAVGVALQLTGELETGSVLVAGAMLCAVLSAAPTPARARGPGQWLAVRPADAFASRRAAGRDALDAGTRTGKLVMALACLGIAGLAFVLRRSSLVSPYLVALDGLALLPLFATGRGVELPPTVGTVARTLRPVFRRLTRNRALRVAPWARVPRGAHEPDELRLLVLPRLAMPGLVGIEIGVASGRASRQYASLPEVLIRVHEASAAHARMTSLVPRLSALTGRRPEERVYRVAPRYPTTGWTRALVERLARQLYDKRKVALERTGWAGEERRVPSATRVASSQAA